MMRERRECHGAVSRGGLMFKALMRVPRAVANRKTQTVTIAIVAAIAAAGFARPDGPGRSVSTIVSEVSRGEVGAVTAAPKGIVTNLLASKTSLDLPNLQHARVDSWVRRFTTELRGSFATS